MNPHVAQPDGSVNRDATYGRAKRVPIRERNGAAYLVAGVIVGIVLLVALASTSRDDITRRMPTVQIMKVVASALEQYQLQHGDYPAALADLSPRYLEDTPTDPWKRPFVYTPTPSGVHPFALHSTGASGKGVIDHWNPPAAE